MVNSKYRNHYPLFFFVLFLFLIITAAVATISGLSSRKTITSKAAGAGYQTASVLFSWYYCPPDQRTCIPDRWKYHPPGAANTYSDGSSYNPDNPTWWNVQAQDMTCAGIDNAMIYIWDSGNYSSQDTNQKFQYINSVRHFVNAIKTNNLPLKISEYWDSSYATGEPANQGGPLDLSNPATAKYRYERFIKPFYQLVPKDLWATEGGRPIITVYRYGNDFYTNTAAAGTFFRNIKDNFRQDFGVEPFLILGHVWTWGDSTASQAADGVNEMFPSATCAGGNAKIQNYNGYTTTTIAAGAWDDNNQGGCHLERNDDGILKLGFSQIPQNNNLLVVESWNELGEGSGIERALDYPKNGGGNLPETYYMDSLKMLLGRTDRPACRSISDIVGNTPPGAPTPTTPPNPNQPTVPPVNPPPQNAQTTLTISPATPSENTAFKIIGSSAKGHTWVHAKVFDPTGKNMVWEAPKNGTQPNVSKVGANYQWTYSNPGLTLGSYKAVFYINCNTGCTQVAEQSFAIGGTQNQPPAPTTPNIPGNPTSTTTPTPTPTPTPSQPKVKIKLYIEAYTLLPKDKADSLTLEQDAAIPLINILLMLKSEQMPDGTPACPFPFVYNTYDYAVALLCYDYEKRTDASGVITYTVKDTFREIPKSAKDKAAEFGVYFDTTNDPAYVIIKPKNF